MVISIIGFILNVIMWFGITPKQFSGLAKSHFIRNKYIIAPIMGNGFLIVFAILTLQHSRWISWGFNLRLYLGMLLFYAVSWMIYIRSFASNHPRVYLITSIFTCYYPVAYELLLMWTFAFYTQYDISPLTKIEYISVWVVGGIVTTGLLVLCFIGTRYVLAQYKIRKRLYIVNLNINKLIDSLRQENNVVNDSFDHLDIS